MDGLMEQNLEILRLYLAEWKVLVRRRDYNAVISGAKD
jgi:hypothetical protein